MIQRSALVKAFGASFAIYLIPLVGPHAFWLLGEYLYAKLTHPGPDRVAGWILMEWGLAIAMQVVAGVLWYRLFARPSWARLVPVAACLPGFFVLANWGYLFALPSRFLIEQDTASELGEWKTVCAMPGMWLAQIRSPPDLPLQHTGQVWLTATGTSPYSILTMPRCQVNSVEMPPPATSFNLPFVSPTGVYLLGTWDNKTAQLHWWVGDGSLRALARPPADRNTVAPILSTDGKWVAWLEAIPGSTVTPRPQHVVIRSLVDDRERLVGMPAQSGSQFVLLGADMERQELTLYEHVYASRSNRLVVLGLDGERRGQPLVAEGVDPQSTTFLRLGSGWVAWDAYRESEPYRLAWSLAAGRGAHRVLKGRGITAVAVDPSGAYLAISTTTSLNIGRIKDSVSVLRASDGVEVWRRNLPTYTRTSVAFLGDRLFAYTDWDGVHATLRVLKIPD